jgi:hypothetical protein
MTDPSTSDVLELSAAEFDDFLDPETSPIAVIVAEPPRDTAARWIITAVLVLLAIIGVAALVVAVVSFLTSTPSLEALWRSIWLD